MTSALLSPFIWTTPTEFYAEVILTSQVKQHRNISGDSGETQVNKIYFNRLFLVRVQSQEVKTQRRLDGMSYITIYEAGVFFFNNQTLLFCEMHSYVYIKDILLQRKK